MMLRTVDIIISTYNRGDRIDATIASIRQSTHCNFILWVLDQSDNDRTERCVLQHAAVDASVRYLRAPLAGISPTRNRGVMMSNATYVLFTNDDCVVKPNWIEALLSELEAPDAWMVAYPA